MRALLTGGATGIGLAFAKSLLTYGIKKVCIIDIREKEGKYAVNELNREFGNGCAMFVPCDVTKHTEMEAIFKKVNYKWKGMDIVINNAGIIDEKSWENEIAINVAALVNGSMLAFKYMGKHSCSGGGTLVNVACILGLQPCASLPVYAGSKHFVIGYSSSIAMPFNYELSNIRVLTICPGITITPSIMEAHKNVSTVEAAKEVRKELNSLPEQQVQNVAKGLIHMLNKGKNGSVWVSEGGEKIYEIQIPHRLNKNKITYDVLVKE